MNGLPYYPRYPRDFLEGTAGMDLELKGAYALILDLIYMMGDRGLPDDPHFISGHLGCSVRKWNSLRKKLIDAGKIEAENGIISNLRADKEKIILSKYQDKQRENRSRPNKNNNLKSPRSHHTDTDTDTVKREAKASQKKKGSRLPENWQLPKAWGEWAANEIGMPESRIRLEASTFRDYWIGASGANAAKLDWQATWRNWIRRSVERKPVSQSSNEPEGYTNAGAFGRVREFN